MKPLKIIQVASGDLWGGAEAQFNTLCKYLNHEPEVQVEAILMNHGELERRLKSNGIPVTVFDELALSSVELFLRLKQYFKTNQSHVVHTHRQKENILASLANRLTAQAVCVRTQHGAPEFEYTWSQWKNKLQIELDRFCGQHLQQAVIVVSEELKHKLKTHFPCEHINVIENGVDLELLAGIKSNAPFREDEPDCYHIGIVGRLVPVKRVDLFLETARVMLDNDQLDKPLRFHVIGDGPLRNSLEQRCADLDLQGDITFHGHVNEVATYIKSLDVLLMCSDHEGLPMTLLEAVALGTPVLSHNAGALVKPFSSREGGVLSESHESESYAKSITGLLTKTQCIAPIVSDISAGRNASRVLDLYRKLIGL